MILQRTSWRGALSHVKDAQAHTHTSTKISESFAQLRDWNLGILEWKAHAFPNTWRVQRDYLGPGKSLTLLSRETRVSLRAVDAHGLSHKVTTVSNSGQKQIGGCPGLGRKSRVFTGDRALVVFRSILPTLCMDGSQGLTRAKQSSITELRARPRVPEGMTAVQHWACTECHWIYT